MQQVNICLKNYKITIIHDNKSEGVIKTDSFAEFKDAKSQIELHPELYKVSYTR